MKKIRVLQLPIGNARGGITQYALQNWKFIDKERFQFDFVTRSKSLDFEEELTAEGCKIHYLTCSSEENEEQFIREMHRVLDEGYDAVHLHTSYWKGFLAEKLAIERKCPVVIVHSHSTMIDIADEQERNESVKKHHLVKDSFPLEYGTHFVACSNAAAEWLFGEQVPKERIQILNNAIDLTRFQISSLNREAYRENLGLNDCFVIGHIGRFTYTKNHTMLIDIFCEVYRQIPHARLMLVGFGELEDKIRMIVREYGLEHAVLFLGKRTDIPHLLQAMDVFLFPSRFEGLGLALIEAQAAGLKCLASKAVPVEAKVTPNLDFASNSISDWVSWTLKASEGYLRESQDHLLKQAGFDLKDQIRNLEKLYAGEDLIKERLSEGESKSVYLGEGKWNVRETHW